MLIHLPSVLLSSSKCWLRYLHFQLLTDAIVTCSTIVKTGYKASVHRNYQDTVTLSKNLFVSLYGCFLLITSLKVCSPILLLPELPHCNMCNCNGNLFHRHWFTIIPGDYIFLLIPVHLARSNEPFYAVQFRKDEVQEEDDIPYKYGFFHMIFSLGAMYFAMLFISWNLDSSARK